MRFHITCTEYREKKKKKLRNQGASVFTCTKLYLKNTSRERETTAHIISKKNHNVGRIGSPYKVMHWTPEASYRTKTNTCLKSKIVSQWKNIFKKETEKYAGLLLTKIARRGDCFQPNSCTSPNQVYKRKSACSGARSLSRINEVDRTSLRNGRIHGDTGCSWRKKLSRKIWKLQECSPSCEHHVPGSRTTQYCTTPWWSHACTCLAAWPTNTTCTMYGPYGARPQDRPGRGAGSLQDAMPSLHTRFFLLPPQAR